MNLNIPTFKTGRDGSPSRPSGHLGEMPLPPLGSGVRRLTSTFNLQPSQKGVALIITVILLSVLTLMILAFLMLSRRERGAVTTTTDTTSARLAADAALANAEAQIIANVLATTNPYNFSLIVSTNYLPPTNGNYPADLTNLFYSPRPPVFIQTNSTGPLDFRFYLDLNRNGVDDPNGWVTNVNNSGVTNGTIFEVGDPEWIGVLQRPDQPYGPNNPFVARFAFIALPIGNAALDLNAIHNQVFDERNAIPTVSPNLSDAFFRNQGVGSWEINLAAFLADLNTNEWGQVIGTPVNGNDIYYYYQYQPNVNHGFAFYDASALLAYRYNNNYGTLASVGTMFGTNGAVFQNDNIDGYSDGPLQTTLANINEAILPDPTNKPWAGADNTNHFFDMRELFDPTKTFSFSTNLLNAGTNRWGGTVISTYDRYTFYRLLSQLGTDSAPESGKMNLNYSNAVAYFDTNGIATNITIIPGAETNFTAWTPSNFFTIAANRMLRDYSQEWLARDPSNYVATFNITNSFGITNIPVLVSNQFVYTPAVQRVLQLAANIYDATTNNTAALGTNFPSVFRPTFWVTNEYGYTNIYINGYWQVVSVTGTSDSQLNLPVNVTDLPLGASVNNYPDGVNVYGAPWIIGAKKGFPNFNEFSMQGIVQVTRKLEIHRPTLTALPSDLGFQTNQMYIFSISNVFGVECWNSYSSNYLDSVLIWARDTNSMTLTNDNGMFPLSVSLLTANITNVPVQWPGTSQPWSQNPNPNFPSTNSFVIPLLTNVILFTNCMYVYNGNGAYPPHSFTPVETNNVTDYPDVGIQPLPQFGLLTTNRLQVIMLDLNNGIYHVIDYVHFAGPDSARNLNAELADVDPNGLGLWNTNLLGTVPNGVNNQINYSDNPIQNRASTLTANDDSTWVNPQGGGTAGDAIASFDSFLNQVINGTLRGMGTDPNTHKVSYATNTLLTVQVPFTPTRTIFQYITWQANDPLVHYVAGDLNYSGNDYNGIQTGTNQWNKTSSAFPILPDLGQLNKRYQPWGVGSYPYSFSLKDSLIYSSDDWDFPTNKFPTIGWLGRVHRGTPWQTVYLKSPDILANNNIGTWTKWTGNFNQFDATNTAPVQDRLLFDLFTTAFNDNATRGQLSVNVEAGLTNNPLAGLAAWSALFSGVEVLTNTTSDGSLLNGVLYFPRPLLQITNFPINPAGPVNPINPPPLWEIVTNINGTRTNFVNVDGLKGAFEHIGDILAVPQLSVQSPFLNWNDSIQQANGISDEMYEWLPQQVMSLLRVGGSPQTPMRYVIYSYGQALKPAPNSIYTGSGPLFGMVTNYQIVSEAATRAVVRFNSVLTNKIYFINSPPTVTNQVINNNAVIERFNVLPPD